MKKLIAVRKSTLAFGVARQLLPPAIARCWPTCRQLGDELILCVPPNLSRLGTGDRLDLSRSDRIRRNARPHAFPAIGEMPYMITLAPYGFYWFKLQERDKSEPAAPRSFPNFERWWCVGATGYRSPTRSVFECARVAGNIWRARDGFRSTMRRPSILPDLGDPVLRYRRQPALLAFFQMAEDETNTRYVMPMQIGGAGSIANVTTRMRLAAVVRAPAKARYWTSHQPHLVGSCCATSARH